MSEEDHDHVTALIRRCGLELWPKFVMSGPVRSNTVQRISEGPNYDFSLGYWSGAIQVKDLTWYDSIWPKFSLVAMLFYSMCLDEPLIVIEVCLVAFKSLSREKERESCVFLFIVLAIGASFTWLGMAWYGVTWLDTRAPWRNIWIPPLSLRPSRDDLHPYPHTPSPYTL